MICCDSKGPNVRSGIMVIVSPFTIYSDVSPSFFVEQEWNLLSVFCLKLFIGGVTFLCPVWKSGM